MEHGPSTMTDAAAAFLASLEEPKLTSLADAVKKLPIEILPQGMASLYAPNPGQKKSTGAIQGSLQAANKPLLLEGSNSTPATAPQAAESGTSPAAEESGAPTSESGAPPTSESDAPPSSESGATPASESGVSPEPESGVPPEPESGAPTTPESGAPTTSETGVSESVQVPTPETDAHSTSESGSNPPPESTNGATGPTSESSAAVALDTSERCSDNPSYASPVSMSSIVPAETPQTSSNPVPTEAPNQLPEVSKPSVRPELPMDFFT